MRRKEYENAQGWLVTGPLAVVLVVLAFAYFLPSQRQTLAEKAVMSALIADSVLCGLEK